MDRMSPLDASFLHIENGISHMHIGSVAIFEGPAPHYEQFEAMVAGKLPAVPRYRQKVRFVPSNSGARSGSTIRISISDITCGTPRSRLPVAIGSCAISSGA